MAVDTYCWEKKNLPKRQSVRKSAEEIRNVLLRWGFKRYQRDEIGKLVIDKYAHSWCRGEAIDGHYDPGILVAPGNIEIMYRKDGRDIISMETTYSNADLISRMKIDKNKFTIRFTNNIDERGGRAVHSLISKVNGDVTNLWKK